MTDWDLEAEKCLRFIKTNLNDAHRGAIQYSHNIIIVFSNHRNGDIASFYEKLARKKTMIDLGSYFHHDESWVILLRAPNGQNKHLNWAMKTIWDCCGSYSMRDYDNAGRLIAHYMNNQHTVS